MMQEEQADTGALTDEKQLLINHINSGRPVIMRRRRSPFVVGEVINVFNTWTGTLKFPCCVLRLCTYDEWLANKPPYYVLDPEFDRTYKYFAEVAFD